MSYVVFDLDETLVNIYSIYYFIASLKLKDHIKEHRSYLSIFFPDELFDEHESAYQRFVKYVLKEEISDKPIGVLRPGILEVMTKLNRLKRKGKVAHVIIYSNNGCLECLQFVRDLIHLHVGNPALITECIHRSHHLRSFEEHTLTKTWSVLRNILIHGACNAFQTISPKDVFFFDDLQHTDLQMNLAEQYYCVPSYQFRASFYRLSELYANAINEAKVDTNMLLINVINVCN
jgi:hypothetical protein